VDAVSAVAPKLAVSHRFPAVEQPPPLPIPDRRRRCRRVDDVDEQQRRQGALVDMRRTLAGDELLDLADQRIDVTEVRDMLVPRQLDEPGVGNVLGQVAPVGDTRPGGVAPVQDECRGPDRRERTPDVRLDDQPIRRHPRGGTDRQASVPCQPLPQLGVVRPPVAQQSRVPGLRVAGAGPRRDLHVGQDRLRHRLGQPMRIVGSA
jgi:hypothetical protein